MRGKILIAAGLTLALLLGGCGGSTRNYEEEINTLKKENVALQQEVASLREELTQLRSGKLERWTLDGQGTTPEEPASVRLTAWPMLNEGGQRAELLALLGDRETARAVCRWDGEAFTGELNLLPEDGYSYYCLLTAPDGAEARILLSDPAHPTAPRLTYLKSSLECFVSANLSEAQIEEDTLSVTLTGTVQTPLLSRDGKPVELRQAELVWVLDGEGWQNQSVEIREGETEGGYSVSVEKGVLSIPEMEEGSQLELYLTAELSDGQILSTPVGVWSMEDGDFTQAVG